MIVVEVHDAGPEDQTPHWDVLPLKVTEGHVPDGSEGDLDSWVLDFIVVAGDVWGSIIVVDHGEEVAHAAEVSDCEQQHRPLVVVLPCEHDSCEIEAGEELAESGEDDAGFDTPAATVGVSHISV